MSTSDEIRDAAERASATPGEVSVPNEAVPVQTAVSADVGLVQRQRAFPLTGAEQFWYVLQCVALGAGYFGKVPMKKALSDISLARMTDAAQFWYVLQCVAFGAGYFAKVIHKKALSEMPHLPQLPQGDQRLHGTG
jgi:hypothetical protein